MAVKFKTHESAEGHTTDVVIRVSRIDNGYVIKAGGPPYHAADPKELRDKVDEILAQFTSSEVVGRPLGQLAEPPAQARARGKRS